jgi:peptidyl-dipeptidase Dcp
MDNPFLQSFDTPFDVPPFGKIKSEHFMPAIRHYIDESRKEIDAIAGSDEVPTFANTIEAMEHVGERLQVVTSVLFNLNAAETTEAIQKVTQEASPELSAFDSEIKQNEKLFARIKAVYENKERLDLSQEQSQLLEKTYKSYVRSGADLDAENKKRFKEISIELSKLGLTFGENLLAETNEYKLLIDKEEDLAGLPDDVIKRAKATAEKMGEEGKWAFTLQAPSYMPFMKYADNRDLREKLYRAFMSKSFKGNERDNQEIIRKLVTLRDEKARLLGYSSFAEYVLEERMALKPEFVDKFLKDLLEQSLPKAQEEVAEMKEFMKELGAVHELQRWDWAYYAEKLRKKKYDLDDELIKPYFKLENVINGVFETAGRLYGLSFKENKEIPVYHEEVTAYEVFGEDGKHVAIFFADFFPREGKRPGAWMTSYRDEKKIAGQKIIPHVSIVCNFTPSSEGNPSLLKFDEVTTLFHEFGHALHGMLADTTYGSLSGTSVFWDFVELPSQIFENWCYEKECLDLFARHYETGEPIPAEYVERIKASSTFHEAYATVRQISFAMLDMAYHYHLENPARLQDIGKFEQDAFAPTELFPTVDGANMSVQFGHIFAGGYAAGYYSYKWAEVLDADAFELFKQRGIFDKETARSFKENILSRGGTEHPMDLYKRFRGQEPSNEALLRRAGLLKAS